MYLQMYWLVAGEGRIQRCKHYRALISRPRTDQDFCYSRDGIENKCTADWNLHHGEESSKEARKRAREPGR
jgi:hypothetical protein